MPNGLLLPGGMEAPHALSTAHCAMVIEAGTLHFRREATAASTTSGGALPNRPTAPGLGGSSSGRAASA